MDKKKELIIGIILSVAFILGVVYVMIKSQPSTTIQNQTETLQPTTSTTTETTYTMIEVRAHNRATDCWFVVNGNVYDVTGYETKHPGGTANITDYCGKDATDYYTAERKHGVRADSDLASLLVGTITN